MSNLLYTIERVKRGQKGFLLAVSITKDLAINPLHEGRFTYEVDSREQVNYFLSEWEHKGYTLYKLWDNAA